MLPSLQSAHSGWTPLTEQDHLIQLLSQGMTERDFHPECQGAPTELGGVGGEKMMCIETKEAPCSWQKNLKLINNDPWPPSKRHMDYCLGTSGLCSWPNERTLCEIVRTDTSSL